jgi:hypothetical protein
MQTGRLAEATRCLTLAEAGAKKQIRVSKAKGTSRFPAGTEWEVIHADSVVLLGLTHAFTYVFNVACYR